MEAQASVGHSDEAAPHLGVPKVLKFEVWRVTPCTPPHPCPKYLWWPSMEREGTRELPGSLDREAPLRPRVPQWEDGMKLLLAWGLAGLRWPQKAADWWLWWALL